MSTLFTLAQDHKLFAWRMKQRKEQEREERKKAHFSRKRGIITPRKKGGRGMSVFTNLEKDIADMALKRNNLPEEVKTLMRIITKLCREGQKLETENAALKERVAAADEAIKSLLAERMEEE